MNQKLENGTRARHVLAGATLSLVALAALAFACGDNADNAKPRSGENGCVADGCYDSGSQGGGDGAQPGQDGSPAGDAPDGGFRDPLEGTTKQATLIKNGFAFTEGPVWIGGRLLFSDIGNTIFELQGNNATAFRTPSGAANGNAVDSQGRLVTCEGANKRVVRSNATQGAQVTPLVALFGPDGGTGFNAPNDVIVRADGNIYFTDPNYGGAGNQTQDREAVYRIPPGATAANRLQQTFNKPNGIALSPDGNTLYVVDNGAGTLMSTPLAANGSVNGAFTKIADTPGGDGIAVDDAGNLYVATNAGITVFDKTGQKTLGTITVAEQPSNCTFGGADRKTLFITARTGVYSIVLNVPGLP